MTEEFELINNKDKHQYEFHVDRYVPLIEYIVSKDGNIYLTHTEVPRGIGGRGIGTKLVEKTLEDIDNRNQKVVPLCPFVAGFIKKNPEWMHVVADGIRVN